VAHILWDARLGGIQKVVLDLGRAQAASGEVRPVVVFARALGPLLEEFRRAGAEVHTLDFRSGYDVRPVLFLRLKHIFQRCDLIHLHSYNPVVARAAMAAGKPILYTEHGNFGFGRKLRWSEKVNMWLQSRFLNRRVDLLTFNSRFTGDIARGRYGLEGVNIRLIYNGVDIEEVMRRSKLPSDLRLPGLVIGTTTRLAGGKRVMRLLEAFRQFRVGRQVHLLIVGDGPEREELESYCRKEGLTSSVTFAGAVSDPVPLQQLMDLCVYPFYHEAFGLVAVETLALGKPALVFRDGGGLAEIVEGVSPADVCEDEEDLLQRMGHWYHDPQGRAAFSAVAAGHAQSFSIAMMHTAMLKAYREVIVR